MKKIYKISVLIFSLIIFNNAKAQELSTQGKTFWLTFMENVTAGGNGTFSCPTTDSTAVPELKIVISCAKSTSGTVKNVKTGHSLPFSIGAGGGVDTVFVPGYMGYCINSETRSKRYRALLVQANDTVAVSAQSSKQFSCDAALIYPIEALGVDYRVLSHIGDPGLACSVSNYRSAFAIVATEDNTSIEITPSCSTKGGNVANTKFTIILNRGESYQVQASGNRLDLSGTLIQALNCKKIAVFGGSNRSSIGPTGSGCGNSYDHLYEQMMPINLWGKKFILAPTIWSKGKLRRYEMIKVVANVNSTAVRFNARPIRILAAGQVDTFWIDSAKCKNVLITSTKPIGVCQYAASEACDGGGFGGGTETDPMMMWVPPIEQSLKSLSFSCENAKTINKFFLNVIVKTSYRSSFKLDGLSPVAPWKLITNDTSYSYVQQDALTLGKHKITSPYGFSAMLYAYGDHGSYGYNAGSSVKPLSFFMTAAGKSSADFELDSAYFSICQGVTVPFDITASYTPTAWKWQLFTPAGLVTRTTKSFSINLPDTGTIMVRSITTRPAAGICNGVSTDTLVQYVKVYGKPKIFLLKDTTICRGNNLYLTSTTDGDTNYTFSPNTWLSCDKCFKPLSTPLMDTTYTVTAVTKGCPASRDTVKIKLRDSLFVFKSNDTTICRGTSATMKAWAKGGLLNNYTFTWSHGLGTGTTKTVAPKSTTTYTVILTDGCTKDSMGSMYADTTYIKVTVHDSLKITMPNDTLVCSGNNVVLTPKYVGGQPGAAVINWDNGLGAGFSKTVTMTTTKTYKAVLSDGCTNPKDSGYVTVSVRPGMKIDTIIFPTPVCKNTLFNVKAKISGGDSAGFVVKLWTLPTTGPSVAIDSFKQSANPFFNTKISDDANFSISLNQKCNSQLLSRQFSVKIKNTLDVISTVPFDTICNGELYDIRATGSNSDNLPIRFLLRQKNGSIYYDIDSLTHSTSASFNVTPIVPKTEFMIVGDDKCNRTDTSYFILNMRPPLAMGKLFDDMVCRRQNTVNYNASVTGGRPQTITYDWRDQATNGALGTGTSVTLNPTQSMDLILIIADGCSRSVRDTARIVVSPVVTDSTLATNLSGCELFSTVFSYPKTQAQTINPQFTWEWYFSGAAYTNTPSSGGQTHPDINRIDMAAGTYEGRVILRMPNNKPCDTFAKTITVFKQAKAAFTYLPTQIDIVEPLVTFNNLSTGATMYTWNFGDTNALDYNANPQHSYKDTGDFVVMLIANNSDNCADTTYQTLKVLDIFRIFIPSAFSPNTDDFNTLWFPHVTSIQSMEFEIFNRWGEKVFQSDGIAKWTGQYGDNLDKQCPEGIYYYHIKVRDNRKKWHYYNGTLTLLR